MADMEKVIKDLHDIAGFIAGRVGIKQAKNFLRTIDDTVALLKEQEEQKRKWLQNIADNQLANAPKHDRDDFMQLDEHLEYRYQLGVYDGLQMAYDILTEGR